MYKTTKSSFNCNKTIKFQESIQYLKRKKEAYDIKKAIIDYINQTIIQKASNGETEVEFKMNESSFRLKKNNNKVFLGWCDIFDYLLLSKEPQKHEVVSMLLNHGFDVKVFQFWNEIQELTTALLENKINYQILKKYNLKDLKINISWTNPKPSQKNIFSLLVTAKKAIQITNKHHKKINNKIISVLYKKLKFNYQKSRIFECVDSEYFEMNGIKKNLNCYLRCAIQSNDIYDKKLYELIYKNGFRMTKRNENGFVVVWQPSTLKSKLNCIKFTVQYLNDIINLK